MKNMPGCVTEPEYALLVTKYHEPQDLWRMCYSLNKENSSVSSNDIKTLQDVGLITKLAGKWMLTEIGERLVESVEARLEIEPVFDMEEYKRDKLRKRHAHLPKAGEMIYLRKTAGFKHEHWGDKLETTEVSGAPVPIITHQPNPTRWRQRKDPVNVKDPILVMGTHMIASGMGVRSQRWSQRYVKDFVLGMVKGQIHAIDPKAIMKRRPAGQGLNKRKKKNEP